MTFMNWLLLPAAAIMAACASWDAAQAEKRHIVIAAVEPKGGVTVEREPFPTERPPAGGGYVLNAPDEKGRWEISAYVWLPSQIVVNQDDEVTLEFVGINGATHPTTIKGYDRTVTVRRGHVHRIEFKADRPGIFAIECATHKPSMVGELIVLPKR